MMKAVGVEHHMGPVGRLALGTYLLLSALSLLFLVLAIWPQVVVEDGAASGASPGALLLAVAVLGALGGTLHAVSSFATYVGNRALVRSWLWWYLLRAPIGSMVAVTLYFVIVGGLLAPGAEERAFNPYGLAALSALAGLMSETATMKLREVFEALFRPRDSRKDPSRDAAPPRITGVEPESIVAGEGDVEVRLVGSGFRDDDVLHGETRLGSTFVSGTEMLAVVPAASTEAAGKLELRVRRHGDPQAASAPVELIVR
jgi:hypothetical protein